MSSLYRQPQKVEETKEGYLKSLVLVSCCELHKAGKLGVAAKVQAICNNGSVAYLRGNWFLQ